MMYRNQNVINSCISLVWAREVCVVSLGGVYFSPDISQALLEDEFSNCRATFSRADKLGVGGLVLSSP